MRFGEYLVLRGLLTPAQLSGALQAQSQSAGQGRHNPLGTILIREGYLSAGQVTEQDAYGASTAWGAALDGNVVIPITGGLFVRGGVEYKHVKMSPDGSGGLTDQFSVWSIGDSEFSGSGHLGIKF